MQKFGLQRTRSGKHTAIELEIAKEQASALGRAGKKLRLSLENYQRKIDQNADIKKEKVLLDEISNNVWELILQREFIGFIEGNLKWVRENYVIPDEAINNLGKQKLQIGQNL